MWAFDIKPTTLPPPQSDNRERWDPKQKVSGCVSVILVLVRQEDCLLGASLGYRVKPFVKDEKGGRGSRCGGGRGEERGL